MRRIAIVFACLTTIITGCVSVASSSDQATPGVGSDLTAVSRSSPDASASAALDLCSITDTTSAMGPRGALGIDVVVGMGFVTHARDAVKYVRLAGVEPEIQTDHPAWLIATKGPIQLPLGPKMWNPTCVVIDGEANWFITGDYEDDGVIVTPLPLKAEPVFALPALAP